MIHEDKVRKALNHHARDVEPGTLRVIPAIRRAVGGLLISLGMRLAPTPKPEVSPGKVVDLSSRRANDRFGPEDAAEDEMVTGSKPAA